MSARRPLPLALVAAPVVECGNCAGLCCRLTVVLGPGDLVPAEHVEARADGLRVMARGASGYCTALSDGRCGIYATRPQACRRFVMAGPYCRAVRREGGLPG